MAFSILVTNILLVAVVYHLSEILDALKKQNEILNQEEDEE